MSKGPVAPKDPVLKNPYFYIMQDKDVFAAQTPENKGVSFIYQNDNRLINSAKIAGNVTDESMLELLRTTEGFRKLVKAIGVSIMEPQAREKVRFVYQMYGKRDTYGSGTNLILDMIADGTEQVIELDQVDWSDDDKEPGQIRLEYENSGILASMSVRFYLNDGYEAPEVILDEAIDEDSKDYADMIARSLMQTGNPARIKKAIAKARRGEDCTLAYIGGSITQGAGAIPIDKNSYAYKSYESFANTYGTGANVHFVKAGVGGTPSELGMLRVERDILRDGKVNPDIIVIEFAVNDEGDETKGVCYESLVRKCLALPNKPAVILLFAVFSYDWNLQDRLSPVGRVLDLPMTSVLDAVVPQFRLRKGEGRVLSKNQFFYDIYHPSNAGHKIMAACITNLIAACDRMDDVEDETEKLMEKTPAIGKTFEDVLLMDKNYVYDKAVISEGAFTETDTQLQCVEMDDVLTPVPEFPYNWMYTGKKDGKNDFFEMKITCKSLLLIYKDSGSLEVGKADVFVDDAYVLTADPLKNGWVHCNPVILFTNEQAAEHVVRIQMAKGDEEKKFTILGFGYVE